MNTLQSSPAIGSDFTMIPQSSADTSMSTAIGNTTAGGGLLHLVEAATALSQLAEVPQTVAQTAPFTSTSSHSHSGAHLVSDEDYSSSSTIGGLSLTSISAAPSTIRIASKSRGTCKTPGNDKKRSSKPRPTKKAQKTKATASKNKSVTKNASKTRSLPGPPREAFPRRLMRMLSDQTVSTVITWLPHGMSFVILRPDVFAERVLPMYFPESTTDARTRKSTNGSPVAAKYPSFTRKLNRWGFRQIARGQDAGAFHHHLFRRDVPDLCNGMGCAKSRKAPGKITTSNKTEPYVPPPLPSTLTTVSSSAPAVLPVPNPSNGASSVAVAAAQSIQKRPIGLTAIAPRPAPVAIAPAPTATVRVNLSTEAEEEKDDASITSDSSAVSPSTSCPSSPNPHGTTIEGSSVQGLPNKRKVRQKSKLPVVSDTPAGLAALAAQGPNYTCASSSSALNGQVPRKVNVTDDDVSAITSASSVSSVSEFQLAVANGGAGPTIAPSLILDALMANRLKAERDRQLQQQQQTVQTLASQQQLLLPSRTYSRPMRTNLLAIAPRPSQEHQERESKLASCVSISSTISAKNSKTASQSSSGDIVPHVIATSANSPAVRVAEDAVSLLRKAYLEALHS